MDNLRANTFREYRQALYAYHRAGLDQMTTKPLEEKEAIMKAIQQLEPLFLQDPMPFAANIFRCQGRGNCKFISRRSKVDFKETEAVLKKIAPFFGSDGNKLKRFFYYSYLYFIK